MRIVHNPPIDTIRAIPLRAFGIVTLFEFTAWCELAGPAAAVYIHNGEPIVYVCASATMPVIQEFDRMCGEVMQEDDYEFYEIIEEEEH